MDYETLRLAFVAFRRKHGAPAARQTLADHGADSLLLDDVPEHQWPSLLAVFNGGTGFNRTLNTIRRNAFARRRRERAK